MIRASRALELSLLRKGLGFRVWGLGVPYLLSICEAHSSYVDRGAGLVLPLGAVPQTRIPFRVLFIPVPYYLGTQHGTLL